MKYGLPVGDSGGTIPILEYNNNSQQHDLGGRGPVAIPVPFIDVHTKT